MLDNNLERAVERALTLTCEAARAHAAHFTCSHCDTLFLAAVVPSPGDRAPGRLIQVAFQVTVN